MTRQYQEILNDEVQEQPSTELQVSNGNNPADMIRMAVGSGANLENLEKLLRLQGEWETRQARKQYAQDFASAQSKIEAVTKKLTNTQTNSRYADLSSVIETSKPVYTEHGFAIIFYEGETELEGHVRICADVLHRAGHKETYHHDVPLDGIGIKGNANMTKIHGKASSVSYGRRYLMCMIWNIPTQDDDGNAAGAVNKLDYDQLSKLRDLTAEWTDKNKQTLLSYLGVKDIEELKSSDFQKALQAIESKNKAKK